MLSCRCICLDRQNNWMIEQWENKWHRNPPLCLSFQHHHVSLWASYWCSFWVIEMWPSSSYVTPKDAALIWLSITVCKEQRTTKRNLGNLIFNSQIFLIYCLLIVPNDRLFKLENMTADMKVHARFHIRHDIFRMPIMLSWCYVTWWWKGKKADFYLC